jgi:ATP-dependent Lon protease
MINAVKLPGETDPFILAYRRVHDSIAPTPQLEKLRVELRLKLSEFLSLSEAHFKECDNAKLEELLTQREELVAKAKAKAEQIKRTQQEGGGLTAMQTNFNQWLEAARNKLNEFRPVDENLSTFAEIEASEAQKRELQDAVNARRRELNSNMQQAYNTNELSKEMVNELRDLGDRVERVTEQIKELQLPAEKRKRPSSVVWEDDGRLYVNQLG